MLCAWEHCRSEETGCVMWKVLAIFSMLLYVDDVKRSGRTLD